MGSEARNTRKTPPATTPEGRESQLVALSMDEAERRIREGTASSQLLVHFLQLGSAKAKLELKMLETQQQLAEAKREAISSAEKSEELYRNAVDAMSRYRSMED